MTARAEGHGRIYQATGDQHIEEHHHHAATEPGGRPGPDSVRHPAVGRVPVRLRDRTELMAHLRATITPEAGGSVYVLHGLGGCGKTAVAHTVFQESTATGERIGLWVNAADSASLRAGMLAVAADRGASDAELAAARAGLRAAADVVWDHLERSDRPWLLVLDNADDPVILRDGGWLRPSTRGIVLVTTRQAAGRWWPGAELHQVGLLPSEAAAEVLCDLAPDAGTAEQAAEVAERLGRLPLALTLAGGFLANQVISPWTMDDYRRNLDDHRNQAPNELIDQGADVGNDARHLVSRTWQLSLDALDGQGLPEAHTLLQLLACWSSDPLPLSLLAGAELGPALPARRGETALRGLLDQSLTELVPGTPRCLRTHGVLLDSVAWSTPADRREELAALAARLLAAPLPEVAERGALDPRLTLLVPHVLALLRRLTHWDGVGRPTREAAAGCALRLAVGLHRGGDYLSALNLARDAAALARQFLPEDHPLLLRLDQRVGRALQRLGDLEQSEALNREVLARCEDALGPMSPDTLESCLGLGIPLFLLDRRSEAVPLIRRAATGLAGLLGPAHPAALNARAALLESTEGPELEREVAAGPEFLTECRQALGPAHPVTLAAEINYANALFRTGRHAEALPLAREVLAAHELRYGPHYPITLAARQLLAQVLAAVGRYPEAVEHIRLVVEGRTVALGPAHPWTLAAQQYLAEFRSGAEGLGQ